MGITLKKIYYGPQIFFSPGPQIPLSGLENCKVLLKINYIYLYRKDIFFEYSRNLPFSSDTVTSAYCHNRFQHKYAAMRCICIALSCV
jgi:hypothetical protein